jgi:hypothetical protein
MMWLEAFVLGLACGIVAAVVISFLYDRRKKQKKDEK